MLTDQEVASRLIAICLHAREVDLMAMYESNYLNWYAGLRVLQTALRDEDRGKAYNKEVQLERSTFIMALDHEHLDDNLLDAYSQYIRPLFKRDEMNILFLDTVKLKTTDCKKPLYTGTFAFSYAQVTGFHLNPLFIERTLYRADKTDQPVCKHLTAREI